MRSQAPSSPFSIRRLRTFILIALVAGVAGFTGVMFTLVQSLSERFGPQVEADLEWRALRGSQELAKTADVGLAVSDPAMVTEAFGVYAQAADVQAIVAIDAHGTLVASHGAGAAFTRVFAAKPATLVRRDGYVASWAPVVIEGNQVGKIAVVVSTRRLTDAQTVLTRVSRTALIAGIAAALLGGLVILFFTRQVSLRDHQLHDYAANLERKVEARTAELDDRNRGMRLVLDHVAQGFITIDAAGVMANERSAIVDRWFGEPARGQTFADYLDPVSPDFVTWFQLGLDGIRDGYMPVQLCLDQMPPRFTAGASTFDIKYSPIMAGDRFARLLLVISDVTAQIVRERAERDQREVVTLFQRITADRAGFDEFLDDAAGMVAALAEPADPVVERRVLHTLKGNCAIHGVESYAELCHAVETELADTDAPLDDDQRAKLATGWTRVMILMMRLLGHGRRNVIEVELAELARLIEQIRQGLGARETAAVLTSWSHEPVARRFERLANHATALARRLGKGELEVVIRDGGLRLDTARWAGFWSALVHAVRNAVDHGVEAPEQRAALAKPARPQLLLAASREHGQLMISVGDDGGGIAWDAVRDKARQRGLAADSQLDLERALFADGVSTSAQASETSGRGVGMAALREAVVALGGRVEIDSRPSAGTTMRFVFPDLDNALLALRAPTQPLRTSG